MPTVTGRKTTLRLPEEVNRLRLNWFVTIALLGLHIVAMAAVVPWLFSWSGLIMACAGTYVFGTLGINVGYHRLLTHRSFICPRWLERLLALLGFCNLQGSSLKWVATHRRHHQHSDEQPDPHSPLVNFLWSHMGWLVTWNSSTDTMEGLSRYAGDLYQDRFHLEMERKQRWIWVCLAHMLLICGAGMAIGWILAGNIMAGVQLGLSWLVWAVAVRLVFVWHLTWAINSITHLWGYRNFETSDNSRNNWFFGYLGMGEGWHNNHHADQRCAAHGRRWWELDVTYLTILLLHVFGLASRIIKPSANTDRRVA